MKLKYKYVLIALALLMCEVFIAVRLSHGGFVRETVGDFLVTPLIFFAIKAVCNFARKPLALGVLIFSLGIEIGQYFHFAQWLGFERGSFFYIVLGNTFSWSDMLMYALGCLVAYGVDRFLISKR